MYNAFPLNCVVQMDPSVITGVVAISTAKQVPLYLNTCAEFLAQVPCESTYLGHPAEITIGQHSATVC